MNIPIERLVDYLISFFALYTVVLFILIYFLNRDKMLKVPKSTSWEPKISVVIPAYNEEKNLPKCIESVLNSNYPKNKIEIIVVDDGSKDNTFKVAKSYSKFGVKAFTKKNEGTAAATKNYGIKNATGEIIATLDADSYISKDAIRKMLPLFEDEKVVAVTSAIKVSKSKTFLQKIQRVEYILTIFSRRILSFIDSVFVTPGPFSMFRKSIFDKLGLFDETSILEDQEIALRFQKHNYKIRSSMDAQVYTDVPGTFFSLVRQRIRWHRGGLINAINYLHLVNPRYGDFGLIIMPLSFLAVVFIFLLIANTSIRVLLGSFLPGIPIFENLLLLFNPLYFVGLVIFLLTAGFTIHQLSYFKEENVSPIWALLYIIVYAYLITLYWLLAIAKQIRGDDVSW